MKEVSSEINKLKHIIQDKALVTQEEHGIVSSGGEGGKWLFDFRNIFLQPDHIDLITELFWDRYHDRYPFQVGGLEVAAIPLISAIVMKSKQKGMPVNGFFIRKSRKKIGLQKTIEGEVNEHPIILVDDLINTGASFTKQIEILGKLKKNVGEIFTLLRFRNSYPSIIDKDIALSSLFTLPDFGKPFLDEDKQDAPPAYNFNIEWYFGSSNPNYFYVVPKSAPAIDEKKLYFGSDSGNFWALNQNDGSVAWKYKVGWHAKGKSIFSSPAIHNSTVYFGSYDGNVYALDTTTGKKKWIFMEADWIGSSPALAPKLNMLFIGLEFGLFKKRGGIAALDLTTGKKKWEYIMPTYTHSSPVYFDKKKIVAVGSNDSIFYLFNAKNGKLIWKYQTWGEIKASCVFDKKRNTVLFGSFDGFLHIVDLSDGKLVYKYPTKAPIFSTPLVYNDAVYVSSLDKRLYSIDLETYKLNWTFEAGGRIFASPAIINNHIFIGSNDGMLYEIDPTSGEVIALLQVTERITNNIVYNKKTDRFFLPTFANEIYCLSKGKSAGKQTSAQ